MTHSLHRRGCVRDLQRDYVVIAMTSALNKAALQPSLPEVSRILSEAAVPETGPSGANTGKPGALDHREFIQATALSSKEALKDTLSKLKALDAGISITVSGLTDEVIPLAQEMGLQPHTINLSMGIVGNTERLPDERVLEFVTMCGHSLIAASLVRKAMEDVESGASTPEEASLLMEKPCVCGIFNLPRGEEILAEMKRCR